MRAVRAACSIPGHGTIASQHGARPTTLPYGEVRVRDGAIAIGVESVPILSAIQRRLYEQAVGAAGVDPDNVLVVRVDEAGIEVDALEPDDPAWPVRTVRVPARDLRRTSFMPSDLDVALRSG